MSRFLRHRPLPPSGPRAAGPRSGRARLHAAAALASLPALVAPAALSTGAGSATAAAPAAVTIGTSGPAIGVSFNAADQEWTAAPMEFDKLAAAGVRQMTTPMAWWYVCPTSADACNFTEMDRTVSLAQQRGIAVTVHITGTPDWLHTDQLWRTEESRRWLLPRDDNERAAFQYFMTKVAARYKGRVQRYEIGNEPDVEYFSPAGISPQNFAQYVAAGYRGVKAADPAAIVTSGGISRSSVGFVSNMLDEFDRIPGAAQNNGYVDEIGIHPYADKLSPLAQLDSKVFNTQFGLTDFNFGGYQKIINLLDSRGRTGTNVWLGEFGYTTSNGWFGPIPDSQRAMWLLMGVDKLRNNPRISGFMWFTYVPARSAAIDPGFAITAADGWESTTFQAVKMANQGPAWRSTDPSCSATSLQATVFWGASCFGLDQSRANRWEVYRDGLVQAQGTGPVASWNTTDTANGTYRLAVAFYQDAMPLGYSRERTVTVANGVVLPAFSPTPQASPAIVSAPAPTVAVGADRVARATGQLDAPTGTYVEKLVVAVRSTTQDVVDFPGYQTPFTTTSPSTTVTSQRQYATGTYKAWVAWYKDGKWNNSPNTSVFTVP